MGILSVKVSGQRIKYEIAKVTFAESDLLRAKSWKWDDKKNSYYSNDKLDIIRDHKDFDCVNAGVAICPSSSVIYYEMGKTKGRIPMTNVLTSLNHPIVIAIRDANDDEGLIHTSAEVYDNENTVYMYSVDVRDSESFDASLVEVICINCPITELMHIVEVRYDGKRMKGGADDLLFIDEPVCKTEILKVPKDYAEALGLAENKRLVNILGFDDFLKEESRKDGKRHKVSEDYIHSFIDEHERDYEPEEE